MDKKWVSTKEAEEDIKDSFDQYYEGLISKDELIKQTTEKVEKHSGQFDLAMEKLKSELGVTW